MNEHSILDSIYSPNDLKALNNGELSVLCAEIRDFLIENVSKTGGHLASNLGAVEISVGLHKVFSCPKDQIMFDVGHQSYVHKILTGRRDRFNSLRCFGGISGFLRPEESECDCFVSGHASNSISAALGMARARKILGNNNHVVCVIGDGALTGGMAYEALNDAGQSGEPLIVVFNDNDMSISKNVGALSKRLYKIRVKPNYFTVKWKIKGFFNRFKSGEKVIKAISNAKARIRAAVLKETIFEIMGFKYLGPADGNDINAVCTLLEEAKKYKQPVLVHLKTVKGKGYSYSEHDPDKFHGVSAFDIPSGTAKVAHCVTFSDIFGQEMCNVAQNDNKVCAITAAMCDGVGLSIFAKRFPNRFFDVGIAEEHAVTMASGIASRGALPVCAIYSTFLQRGYDQLLHDVAIAKNHVVFAVDRAGLVGSDGQTHQGQFDVPYLLTVPGMQVLSPASFAELRTALHRALYDCTGPIAIRYPRGGELEYKSDCFSENASIIRQGDSITLVSYGIMINQALSAAKIMTEHGINAEVVKLNSITDFHINTIINSAQKTGKIIVLEDCVQSGSIGEKIACQLALRNVKCRIKLMNLGDTFIKEGAVFRLYQACGIDGAAVAAEGERLCRE